MPLNTMGSRYSRPASCKQEAPLSMTNHHQTCVFPDMPNAFLFTVPLLHASSLSFESADIGRNLRPQTLCFIDVMFSFSISSVSWNIIVLLPLSVTCFSPLDLYSFDFIFILQSIFKGKKIKQTKDFYSFICFKFYHLPFQTKKKISCCVTRPLNLNLL